MVWQVSRAGDIALEDLDVLTGIGSDVVVVADQAPGLELMNQRVQLIVTVVVGLLPLLMVPVAVKPDAAHLAVAGQQLGQLALHEIEIGVGVGGLGTARTLTGTSAGCVRPQSISE